MTWATEAWTLTTPVWRSSTGARYKTLSEHHKRLLKRRPAIEPAIGHTKADHRMDRCWLQGATGDALHALCCAADYNIRWLMRAIARNGLKPAIFRILQVVAASQSLSKRILELFGLGLHQSLGREPVRADASINSQTWPSSGWTFR